jgi:NAD(P)-dependent dehydrogenase (short-subunit alcohol dehydrogenase family)
MARTRILPSLPVRGFFTVAASSFGAKLSTMIGGVDLPDLDMWVRGVPYDELVTLLVPRRRAARADEVAEVVAWLLSDAASYVNGAVIPVDGSAAAVDVGTLPFDPRVDVRRQDGS